MKDFSFGVQLENTAFNLYNSKRGLASKIGFMVIKVIFLLFNYRPFEI